jgi:hypothetical protein
MSGMQMQTFPSSGASFGSGFKRMFATVSINSGMINGISAMTYAALAYMTVYAGLAISSLMSTSYLNPNLSLIMTVPPVVVELVSVFLLVALGSKLSVAGLSFNQRYNYSRALVMILMNLCSFGLVFFVQLLFVCKFSTSIPWIQPFAIPTSNDLYMPWWGVQLITLFTVAATALFSIIGLPSLMSLSAAIEKPTKTAK